MSSREENAARIFLEAVEQHEPSQRSDFVKAACAEDSALRERVEVLLEAHDESNPLLDGAQLGATIDPSVTEQPGTHIGPYKLLQEIGHGGMGVVYMAEQNEPVKRRVALKIIKPGLDTRQVIARFEAERQALAMMDHPNIAKVLDAGSTESGRPYFVMELVNGVPVTEYCDGQHLTPKERLELFLPVCHAVQHAHQKAIIHRDLKPSNVLVALYDGQPTPKVIDFGVAKATSQSLTEKTLFTQLGQIVGTLEYMSPEQAQHNQLDIDTRSDVYSLGVLLYELLTGTTPFDKQRLRTAAFDEMLRIIREEEPPPPSTRLTAVDSLPSIAANRHVEPGKLRLLVRGELDWIVMRALEKDRGRRYETADGFAADIKRYLDDEPVVACPPSVGYRFRKFARRNTAVLATSAVVAAALILGTVVSSWQAVRANHAEQRAQENFQNEQQANRLLREANEAEAAARSAAEDARELAEVARDDANATVDRYFTAIANDNLLNAPAMQGLRRELLEEAEEHYEKYADQDTGDPHLQAGKATAYFNLGRIAEGSDRFDAAKSYFRRAIEIQAREPNLLREYGNSLNSLGIVHDRQRKFIEALQWYRQAAVQRQRLVNTAKQERLAELQETRNNDRLLELMEYELSLANVFMNIGLTLRELKPADLTDLPVDLREFLADDTSGEARGPLAFFQEANGNRRQQLAVLESLMEDDSANTELRSRYGKLRRDLGKGYFSQALFVARNSSLGNAADGYYQDAVENFQLALEEAPNDMEVQFVLALCRRAFGELKYRADPDGGRSEFEKARPALERLVYFNPKIPRYQREMERLALAFRNLGIVQYQGNKEDLAAPMENFRSAEQILTHLEQQFPSTQKKRLDETKQLIKRFESYGLRELNSLIDAKEFDPALALADELASERWGNGRSLNQIAWILATKVPESHRDLKRALRIAERANTLQDHANDATLDTVARIYYELGDLEQAIAWQQKAVEHASDKNVEELSEHLREYQVARGGDDAASAPEEPGEEPKER